MKLDLWTVQRALCEGSLTPTENDYLRHLFKKLRDAHMSEMLKEWMRTYPSTCSIFPQIWHKFK